MCFMRVLLYYIRFITVVMILGAEGWRGSGIVLNALIMRLNGLGCVGEGHRRDSWQAGPPYRLGLSAHLSTSDNTMDFTLLLSQPPALLLRAERDFSILRHHIP